MAPILPAANGRSGQPFAAALALMMHAGLIAVALDRTAATAPQPVNPVTPIVLPIVDAPVPQRFPGAPGAAPGSPVLLPPAPPDPTFGGLHPVIAPLPLSFPDGVSRPVDPARFTIPPRSGPVILPGANPGEVIPPRLLDSLNVRFSPDQPAGVVDVEYVIETTGRMELSSYHVVGHPDSGLAALVRSALVKAHFQPAREGDHPVRALVRQRFRFERGGSAEVGASVR